MATETSFHSLIGRSRAGAAVLRFPHVANLLDVSYGFKCGTFFRAPKLSLVMAGGQTMRPFFTRSLGVTSSAVVPDGGAGRRLRGLVRSRVLAASLVVAACVSNANAVNAALIADYTMTGNSVSGTYGGTPFTNQPLTIKFLNFDTANLSTFASLFPVAYFTNGANMTITVGSILTDAPLDNVAGNSTGLLASSNDSVYLGAVDGGSYSADRGFMNPFTTPPASATAVFTTTWSSVTGSNGAATSSGWGSTNPYTIAGQLLVVPDSQTSTGSFSATVAVPEPGTCAVALARLTWRAWSLARRRPQA